MSRPVWSWSPSHALRMRRPMPRTGARMIRPPSPPRLRPRPRHLRPTTLSISKPPCPWRRCRSPASTVPTLCVPTAPDTSTMSRIRGAAASNRSGHSTVAGTGIRPSTPPGPWSASSRRCGTPGGAAHSREAPRPSLRGSHCGRAGVPDRQSVLRASLRLGLAVAPAGRTGVVGRLRCGDVGGAPRSGDGPGERPSDRLSGRPRRAGADGRAPQHGVRDRDEPPGGGDARPA